MNILGQISTEQFLAEYWQKKPLLIRNACADFEPPLDADELAGLSLEEEVESRLVIGPEWSVQHGPFDESTFQTLPEKDWTILVQAVDLWVPEVSALLDHFDFVPRWRLDDIMISYAADGGSVGPHFDYYDVFLIQGSGQREWRIGQYCDENSALLPGTPLRILSDFQESQRWLTNPGDMLYLPPMLAHYGIARGDNCTTYSVGFRAPSIGEMINDLATEVMSGSRAQRPLIDPPLSTADLGETIPASYLQQVRKQLLETLDDEALLADWLGRYLTAPKYPDLIDITEEQRSVSILGKRYQNGEH